MRQTVSALLCILAIITGTNAQGPQLSSSYLYQGTGMLTATEGTTVTTTTYTRFDVAVDISRRLRYTNFVGVSEGATYSIYQFFSGNDNTSYLVLNGICTERAFISNASDPMISQADSWSQYDNAVENPPGTFTITGSQSVTKLVTTNGLPTSITGSTTTSSLTTLLVITITSFTNSTPQFSTFTLPAACSQSTCNACYSSAVNLGSSFILMLLALVALAVMYSTV